MKLAPDPDLVTSFSRAFDNWGVEVLQGGKTCCKHRPHLLDELTRRFRRLQGLRDQGLGRGTHLAHEPGPRGDGQIPDQDLLVHVQGLGVNLYPRRDGVALALVQDQTSVDMRKKTNQTESSRR